MHDLIPATLAPDALTVVEIEAVMGFAENAKAAGTRRAYASDFADFSAWCAARGACPLPATPALVCGRGWRRAARRPRRSGGGSLPSRMLTPRLR